MRYLLLLVLFAAFSVSAVAQAGIPSKPARCSTSLADSPQVRGLKLGMTRREILSKLGSPDLGSAESEEWDYRPVSRPDFDGVMYFSLSFFEDKLYVIDIAYDGSVAWESVGEFGKNVSDSLKLPNDAWRFEGPLDRKARMVCSDFAVEIAGTVASSLRLTNLAAVNKKVEYERTRELERKKAFKP